MTSTRQAVSALALLTGLAFTAPALAQTPPAADVAAAIPQATLTRATTIADLGFRDPVSLDSLGGEQNFFFPWPEGVPLERAVLRVVFDTTTAYPAQRSLKVKIGDRVAGSMALPQRTTGQVFEVPILPEDVRDGFIAVSVHYAGVFTDNRCMDRRLAGDALVIRPESALSASFVPSGVTGVANVLGVLPTRTAIYLPARPLTEQEVATALIAAQGLKAQRHRIRFETLPSSAPGRFGARSSDGMWSTGAVVIASPADLQPLGLKLNSSGSGTIEAVQAGGMPVIAIHGQETEQAALLLGSPWEAAASAPGVDVRSIRARVRMGHDIPFSALQAETIPKNVVGESTWSATWRATDLPADQRARALKLDVAVANDGSETPPVISVMVNKRLVASRMVGEDTPTRFEVPLPEGVLGFENAVDVRVTRQPKSGECSAEPQGYPAQLLDSSVLMLEPEHHRVEDFFTLPSRFAGGVILRLGIAPDKIMASLPALSDLLSRVVPASAPIVVSFDMNGQPPKGAFIQVSDAPPVDVHPPVRFDAGRVMLTEKKGENLLDISGLQDGAVVQLVEGGLWVRPLSNTLRLGERVVLDRGNVAVFDGEHMTLGFSTERDDMVQVVYPDRTDWQALFAQYRPWVIGAVWLAATLIFVTGMQRMFRRRSAK